MKILAVDIGEKRIGLAISDEMGIVATPIDHVERKVGSKKIIELVEKENVETIVVGIPFLASGKLGSQAQDVWAFAEELRSKINIPIDFENELLTSVEAENRLKGKKKKSKGDIDSEAAAIILESYLERKKKK